MNRPTKCLVKGRLWQHRKRISMHRSNDHLIDELLRDPTYDVREDGTIWTTRSRFWGHEKGDISWRQTGLTISTSPNRKKIYRSYILRYGEHKLKVSRIVYRKFLGKLDPVKSVDHIDENTLNNHPSNLQQLSSGDNFRKSRARLTPENVEEIRRRYSSGEKQKCLAEDYEVTQATISAIVTGKTW